MTRNGLFKPDVAVKFDLYYLVASTGGMDPARSSIGGGIAATATLTVFLLLADLLLSGTSLFVFATFTSLCAVGGEPYCTVGSPAAAALTYFWFSLLFVFAWPLLFGGFTWGLPGDSGLTHGGVFALILWAGYALTVLLDIGLGRETFAETVPFVVITLIAYLVYGVVLGSVYDRLAGHRTFLSEEVTDTDASRSKS